MKIAVNTRLLVKNKLDGIGRFSVEILKRMVINNPKIEFHFIFDRPFTSDFIFSRNIKGHILSPQTRHPLLWYIWFEIQLPKLIKRINPDLFFSPDGFISTKITSIPTITTIHDINFEHYPENMRWTHSIFYRRYFKKYAELAKHIITVSNFSKQDLIKTYKLDPSKITSVYNGISDIFSPINTKEKNKIKQRYSDSEDFFVFIGSLHKRKNIKNLLLAFEIYKTKNGKNKMLIIGEQKWLDASIKTIFEKMQFKNEIIFLGYLEDNIMSQVLASATALCFISLFEGFGLPIIEAMKSKVPVITSNTSCMPEIADGAALLVNPYSIESIVTALKTIEENKQIRKKLIEKGYERSKHFDWEKTTNLITQILKKHAKN